MPDNVYDTFDQIRQFVKWDLNAIFGADHGGNYAATLLIAVGCEALSRLLDKPKNHFFASLLTKRGLDPIIADDVADAIRNGVAHLYDTLFVKVDDRFRLELIISWGQRPHLTVRKDPPGLYLNARVMWEDVRALFEGMRTTLPRGGIFPQSWIRDSVHGIDSRQITRWREWFATAKENTSGPTR